VSRINLKDKAIHIHYFKNLWQVKLWNMTGI